MVAVPTLAASEITGYSDDDYVFVLSELPAPGEYSIAVEYENIHISGSYSADVVQVVDSGWYYTIAILVSHNGVDVDAILNIDCNTLEVFGFYEYGYDELSFYVLSLTLIPVSDEPIEPNEPSDPSIPPDVSEPADPSVPPDLPEPPDPPALPSYPIPGHTPDSVLDVFGAVGTWIIDSLGDLSSLLYSVESGVTVLGFILLCFLGIGIIFMLIMFVVNFLRFRK